MASFTTTQWKAIQRRVDEAGSDYGLPKRRRDSVVFASFNIRKFGRLMWGNTTKRSTGSWEFIRQFCERCDLIAIQEVLDDTSSLRHLQSLLGPSYRFIVSDTTGGVPGRHGGSRERLAFLYREGRVKPTSLASDISFERSAILDTLYSNRANFQQTLKQRAADLENWTAKNKLRKDTGKRALAKPPFVLEQFVQFIRCPHIVSLEVPGRSGVAPYRFLTVNAHLLYGDKSKQREERYLEFKALIGWLIERAKELDRVFEPNILLFGDLNLDLKQTDLRRRAIESFLNSLNRDDKTGEAKINLPFLDPHPKEEEVFRTNARRSQTYDHIGIIARDKRLPPPHQNDEAGANGANGYDYGMFDFVRLFMDAVPEASTSSGRPNYRLFEYDVSDHMPIWTRLPKPHDGQPEFRWR